MITSCWTSHSPHHIVPISISGYSVFFTGHENCECYLLKYHTTLSGTITSAANCNLLWAVMHLKIRMEDISLCQFGCAPLWSQLLSDGISNGTSCLFWHIFITLSLHCSWQQGNEKGGITCQTHFIPSAHSLRFIWGFYSKMTQGKGTTVCFFVKWSCCEYI